VGSMAQLSGLEARLTGRLEALLTANGLQYALLEKELYLAYLFSVGGFLLLSALSALLISRRLAGPIKELAASVQQFVQSDFRGSPITDIRARDVEVVELAHHFTCLQEEIRGQIDRLNERVRERTAQLELEKEMVQRKNAEITASLRYARGIQESMLNSSRNIAELLPESFLLNAPRDIVGGDFLWTHKQEVAGERRIYFAVADCTGHGVPASLMSVMFHHAMNAVVKEMRLPTPARILERVKESSMGFLGNENGIPLGDGMSISLCMYDPATLTLTFSGSFQSIFILNEGELIRVKGDRIFIGAAGRDHPSARFVDHHVELAEGAMVYLCSDGFADQFGGEAGRKFSAGNFRKLLAQAEGIPIAHQHKYFQDAFSSWKGGLEQVDDVMLLGIRATRAPLLPLAQQVA
jgi:serine phosphatase RsbU (regulator of sigma subunit)